MFISVSFVISFVAFAASSLIYRDALNDHDPSSSWSRLVNGVGHVRRAGTPQPTSVEFYSCSNPESTYDKPIANAALWQEAIANDEKTGGGGLENRNFYRLVANQQCQENTSFFDTQMSDKTPLEGSAIIGQGLQYIQLAPTQFNQLQANQPDKSISRSSQPLYEVR